MIILIGELDRICSWNYYLIDGSIKENIAFGQTEDKIDLVKQQSLNVSH